MDTGMTSLVKGSTSLSSTEIFNQKKKNVLSTTLVKDQLIANLDNFESIQVYDLSGKMLLNSHQVSTRVTFLAAGTYVDILIHKYGETYKTLFIKK